MAFSNRSTLKALKSHIQTCTRLCFNRFCSLYMTIISMLWISLFVCVLWDRSCKAGYYPLFAVYSCSPGGFKHRHAQRFHFLITITHSSFKSHNCYGSGHTSSIWNHNTCSSQHALMEAYFDVIMQLSKIKSNQDRSINNNDIFSFLFSAESCAFSVCDWRWFLFVCLI